MAALAFMLFAAVALFGTILFLSEASVDRMHDVWDPLHGNSSVLAPGARNAAWPQYAPSRQQALVRREDNSLLVDTSSATASVPQSFVFSSEESTSVSTTSTPTTSALLATTQTVLFSSSSVLPASSATGPLTTTASTFTSEPTTSTFLTPSASAGSAPTSDIAPSTTLSSTSTSTSTSTSSSGTSTGTGTTTTTSSSSSASGSETTQVFSSVVNGSTIIVTQTSIVTQSSAEPSSSSNDSSSSSSGLSDTNKIVVGVVVGVGGAILMGLAALLFILKRRKSKGHESGWTFWRKNEKGGEDNFFNGELGVRDRDINQGSNF